MKKIISGTMVACCALILWGCAYPEKPVVYPPQSRIYPSTPSTGYRPPSGPVQDINTAAKVEGPGTVDIVEGRQGEVLEADIKADLPSIGYVEERIYEYGQKLDRWKELDSQAVNREANEKYADEMVQCFQKLQNVLNGYSELRSTMLQAQKTSFTTPVVNSQVVFELQKNDIEFLEGSCGRLLAGSESPGTSGRQREEVGDGAQYETLILGHAANHEYEEIVQVWSQMPESQAAGASLRTRIIYGNALMYLGQQEKATEVYRQVVDQVADSNEQATDLVSLRRVLADLYTASGNYQAAEDEYIKISIDYNKIGRTEEWSRLQLSLLGKATKDSPELREYSSILGNFLGFLPEKDGYKVTWQADKFLVEYPTSLVAANVEQIKEATQSAAERWYNGVLAEVDRLKDEKKFGEARKLLETIPKDIVGAENQLVLEEKSEAILLAETAEKETTQMVMVQDLQNQWNNGLLLEKGGRYDEAIALYTSLLGTEYAVRAEEKIGTLSLEAANADRRKAADLFIRFTKTADLESKKKLLIESRQLLKGILTKYPDVEINDKVRANIERVEQEMNAIDPGLISLADQMENPSATGDSVDRIFSAPIEETATRQLPAGEKNLGLPGTQ